MKKSSCFMALFLFGAFFVSCEKESLSEQNHGQIGDVMQSVEY